MKKIFLFLFSIHIIIFAIKNAHAKTESKKKALSSKRIVLKKTLIKGDIDNTLKIPLLRRERFYYNGPEIIILKSKLNEKEKKINKDNE